MGWVIRTNLKGPTGTIDEASAELLPAGAAPTIDLSGTPAHRKIKFGIPKGDRGFQGLPGTGAVPADEAVAGYAGTPGTSATKTALKAGFVSAAGDTVAASHAQLGPATRTLDGGQAGILGFINNAPTSSDNATRIYVMPRDKVTTGVGATIKLFADVFFDATDYRDFGMYFAANQNNDTGHHGTGVWWLNSKVGTNLGASAGGGYGGKNPDIGFSFQDGNPTAGRFSLLGPSQPVFIAGAGIATTATFQPTVRLEVHGDQGMGGVNRKLWWHSVATNAPDSNLSFAVDRFDVTVQGARKAHFHADGSWVMGDGSTNLAANSTAGFMYVRAMGTTPTGVPVARPGTIPMVFDGTGQKLWAYIGGAWKSTTFA